MANPNPSPNPNHTKAQLMGYATHAEFVTEVRMSGQP